MSIKLWRYKHFLFALMLCVTMALSCSPNEISGREASRNNDFARYDQKDSTRNETSDIGTRSTRVNPMQRYHQLLEEMEKKGYDVSKAKDLEEKATLAKREGDQNGARKFLQEAISTLKSLESGASIVPQATVDKEVTKEAPVELKTTPSTVSLPISAEKAMAIDTFPLDTKTVSSNTLQNFHYYELNAKDGTVVLNIKSPVIVTEYPYPDFKVKNNKAFGATESGQLKDSLSDLSSILLNSRQTVIMDMISQAGIGIARDFKSYDTRRDQIEPQKRDYDFSRSDYAVNVSIGKKIDYIGRITPHRIRGKGGLPEDEEDYIAYIKQTVNRYKGRVKYWQILKEPEPRLRGNFAGNDGGLNPEDVVRILELSYKAIKSVDKDSKVYFPGSGPPFKFGGYTVDSYFEKIISLGGAKYFDVLGFDAYVYDIEEQAIKYRKILKKYGYDKPLWVAQTGVPDSKISLPISFRGGGSTTAQCEFMVKAYARAFALGIGKVFWGEFLDESLAEAKGRDEASILWDRTGLFYTGTWEKKPAYFTHRLLASVLYGFIRADKLAPNMVKFVFADKKSVYIVWPDK